MALSHNPRIVTDGLVLCLDAANPKSYPGSGVTWKDLSGNGNDGTLVNGVGYDSANNGSMVFDGVDDRVDLDIIEDAVLSSYTISFFAKSSSFNNNYGPIIMKHERFTSNSDIEIYGGNGGITIAHNRSNGGTFRYEYTPSLNNNQFVQFCLKFDNSNAEWQRYDNGKLLVNYQSVPSPLNNDYPITIGFGFSSYFNGDISNVQIYNRALSDAEIKQNFNALRGRYGI